MSEDQAKSPEGQEPKKKLSPIEQLRAKKAAEAADSSASDGGEKKLSPLEQMRAKKAAAAGGGADSGKKLSPLEQLKAKKAAAEGGAEAKSPAAKSPAKAKAADSKTALPSEKPKPRVPSTKPGSKAKAAAEESRRGFIQILASGTTWVIVAWAAFAGAVSAATLSSIRFMYPNVLKEPPSLFKIGPPDQFAEGEVSERWKNKYGVWVCKANGRLFALRTVCTHLGCTPNWLEGEQKFKCPCHGSGFRKEGINFEGPAPRPLERYVITLADDGQVQVDKSRILHEELGQWTPENGAFIDVS